jgi:hypothetical protein
VSVPHWSFPCENRPLSGMLYTFCPKLGFVCPFQLHGAGVFLLLHPAECQVPSSAPGSWQAFCLLFKHHDQPGPQDEEMQAPSPSLKLWTIRHQAAPVPWI